MLIVYLIPCMLTFFILSLNIGNEHFVPSKSKGLVDKGQTQALEILRHPELRGAGICIICFGNLK